MPIGLCAVPSSSGGFIWFFCAYLAYVTAGQRHRRPLTWGILGIIFGPIALFAVYLMPRATSTGRARRQRPSRHDHAGTARRPHAPTKTQADLYEVPKHKHKD